jgi:hypothetical protein
LKADIGTQVVADDPYFGGKVSFLKFILTLIQTISRGKQVPDARKKITRKLKPQNIGKSFKLWKSAKTPR